MKPKSWMYKRAIVHTLYFGLSLFFATRFVFAPDPTCVGYHPLIVAAMVKR